MTLLNGITVLEVAEGVAGPVCGLQLADLGATVVKIEPPGGDRVRGWGPPLASGASAIFEHLNRGKRSVVLDLGTSGGRSDLEAMLAGVDVVIAQQDPPRGMDWEGLVNRHSHLVVCEITDMGKRGSYSGRSGSELICQALSGFTRYIGEIGKEPMRIGFEISGIGAGMHAVQAALAGLLWRARRGEGQVVRVSALGSLLSIKTVLLAAQTNPDVWEGFHLNGPCWPPDTGWQTKDGQVTFDFRHARKEAWGEFCKAVGLGHLVDDPTFREEWRATTGGGDRRFDLGQVYRPVFSSRKSEEISGLVNRLGGISMKFHDYAEFLAHPQVQVLDPWVNVPDAPEGAKVQVGTPFRLAGRKVERELCRAPRLGEHTDEVLKTLRTGPPKGQRIGSRGVKSAGIGGHVLKGPLVGLKVLDVSQGGVGPWAGSLLGIMGADVVKLESPQGDFIHMVKPTQKGLATTYSSQNINKRGIVLNTKQESDREKAHVLIQQADVFIENFRPGTAERIGLGYEELSKINPRLIYASACGYGREGPLAGVGATDSHVQAFSGSTSVNGKQGGLREENRWRGQFDVTTAMVIVQGVLTALFEREHTGRGQRVDITMTQAGMALQRVRIAEYLGGGRPVPMGSGTTYLVPDQAFATQDRYIAVSATNEDQWRALCGALGLRELAEDSRFVTNVLRINNREALIPLLAERFLTRPVGYWLRVLNGVGVPCSLFMTFDDFRYHIHYLENEFLVTLKTSHWGEMILGGLPWRFSKTPCSFRSGSAVGEFTKEIVERNWPDP